MTKSLMKNRRNACLIVTLFLFLTGTVKAQGVVMEDVDLNKVGDIRSQLEKLNGTYSRPVRPGDELLRFLNKDKPGLSETALYWINFVRDSTDLIDGSLTFRDTVIVNPLFLPLVYQGGKVKNLAFGKTAPYKPQDPLKAFLPKPEVLPEYARKRAFEERMHQYFAANRPHYFRYTRQDMPKELIAPEPIRQEKVKELPVVTDKEAYRVEDMDAPVRFIPERRYWHSAFESAVHFSQNYFSPNWHKGGTSNLNLLTRNYLKYDYQKDKVQLTNEMELKISTYTAPKDTLRSHKIGEDVFCIHSNLGYRAFNKWYYTFDAEFRTQLFSNFQENSMMRMAALLSPISFNFGLGMKYELNKSFTKKHKRLSLALNMAPVSYTYMYSLMDDPAKLDLGRHGFKRDPETNEFQHRLSQFGSTVRADLTFNFDRNISWQSRVYYFTSFDRVVGEFENTLTMGISRFFSTRIYLHLRFDDGVAKKEDFDSYLQTNELLSFGFNYKW
ncbi:hypothetical protein Barb4_01208 [Bacteroidales bacterium Barb4]|nr:hypothetical protein Barb4_01208 [Bacteroidales bacterium Barb4]